MDVIDLYKARVKELIGFHEKRGALSSFEQDEVNDLSLRFLGCSVPNCNCRNIYSDYLFLILNKLNKGEYTMKQSLFRLKKGVVIHVNGEAYTNANLTDDVAKAYLKKYPNTKFFESIPEPVHKEPADDDITMSPIKDIRDLEEFIYWDLQANKKIGDIREEFTGITLQDGTKAVREIVTMCINRAKERSK